jgi:hypothetical protein
MEASILIAPDHVGLTPEQVKRRVTSIIVLADYLERGLQFSLRDLKIMLTQMRDSGLFDLGEPLGSEVRRLCDGAEALVKRVKETYPESSQGGASHLIRRRGLGLLQEVDIYRQEQFWRKEGAASLAASEILIAQLFRFYSEIESLMRQVDSFGEAGVSIPRSGAPKPVPNPYEKVFLSTSQPDVTAPG